MTSLAFVFGVLPLAVASGADSGGQNAIGRSVVGGMISATVLTIFFVPLFFVAVKKLFKQELIVTGKHEQTPTSAPAPAQLYHENSLSPSPRPLFSPGAIWPRKLYRPHSRFRLIYP